MNDKLREAIRRVLSTSDLNIDTMTERQDVIDFIQSVRPKTTDRPLVRIGPRGDGGYLIPDDLDGLEACFSPGVGDLSSFESECAEKYGMRVFLADNSVDAPALVHKNFNFIKKHIGVTSNADTITLDDWIKPNLTAQQEFLMQMDIEGEEYFSLLSLSNDLLKRCRILSIEFHDLQRLWNRQFYTLVAKTFEKLLENHVCVHLHPNNASGVADLKGIAIPRVCEFTFIRKDRVTLLGPVAQLPHPLDYDNEALNSIVMQDLWYKE